MPRRWLAAVAAALTLGAATLALAQAPTPAPSGKAVAIFAGGCFWCMEPPFDKIDGVTATISGYTGGHKSMPTYEQVTAGRTGHIEAVKVEYDPAKVTYAKLLEVFWRNIDPLDDKGQFCDKGESYLSAIFPVDEAQRKVAEASLEALVAAKTLPGKIVTRILPAATFWPAEEYHQDYYLKNPNRYQYYRWSCGRDARLKKLWGEPAAK
ncbi:MAG: peptide-methionine (S)-S-oxide reductase MsrA [Rhodospirillales bacterium]|nr:peptide-methionine (S)-S-oxide reductase MsrA [Rhodospirillales bacterium]QQS14954.1 MAG: peptide-methionine (S)-S-oxide reductase MsrA [Rhodospirillales bacterium]